MNSKNKIGVFSVLLFGVMMLLIPATSIASAQEYDRYYQDDRYYYEDEYQYENHYYPPTQKDKKDKKEPPMLLVKKDVLYCDVIANGTDNDCEESGVIPGPDSGRYVQECTADNLACDINEDFYNIVVTDNIEFPGSEEGTKLNLNGERFTVTEESELNGLQDQIQASCQESGFDDGVINSIVLNVETIMIGTCVLFEGDCSGVIQDGELKECTVENYLIAIIEA